MPATTKKQYARVTQVTLSLCLQNRKELLEKRGLDQSWVEANYRSVSAEEATRRLDYPAKSGGILLEVTGIQVQFKPDNPWKKEGEKKAPKYRSTLCKIQNQGGQV